MMSMIKRCSARVLYSTLAACCTVSAWANADDYLFVNGELITMTNEEVLRADLRVRDGRIAEIGASLPRGNATVIDLAGGYLMPGLSEMHAHVPAPAAGQEYRDDVLFLYVANGVTTIRGMLGNPAHLTLRDALNEGLVLGPRLITSGPSFNGNSVSSPAQAQEMVRAQHAAGYDFLKIHPGLTLAEYDAMAAVARKLDMVFAGHVPMEVGLLHALESGQATIDHLDGYVQALVEDLSADEGGLFVPGVLPRVDEQRIEVVVAATYAADAWVVPTQTLLENFAAAGNLQAIIERPQNDYLPRSLFARYQRALSPGNGSVDADTAAAFLALRARLIRQLHASGVGILLGSDAPQIFNVPGFSVHRELASMVAAGLSPFEALETGTTNPASYFEMQARFGKLEVGLSADFIWLSGNPLVDIGNTKKIQGVMLRGRWLNRDALDHGLAKIRSRHRE